MPPEPLNEREFELINIIGAKIAANQRDLSRHLDLSLGQTNMLIRRLVAKGYIRISQLNKRKVKYLLTPRGFAEKMRKSVKYTLKTIRSISLIKDRIRRIIQNMYEQGERNFIVVGKSDFAFLIEIVLQDMGLKDCRLAYLDELPREEGKGIVLICKENVNAPACQNDGKMIVLIRELAKDENLMNHHNSKG